MVDFQTTRQKRNESIAMVRSNIKKITAIQSIFFNEIHLFRLRGWVPEKMVQNEFDIIKRHKQQANSCAACKKTSTECTHLRSQTTGEAIKELIRKRTLKPFFILFVIGGVTFFSGTHHLNAFMVQILNTYRSPMNPNWATVCFLHC